MADIEVNVQEVQETVAQDVTATESQNKKSAKDFFVKLGGNIKEFFRKLMVSLKRRPHNVALVMLAITFVVYSFNLTDVSNTTANLNLQNSGMGLCEFATMLFSILSIVSFLNAFPKREKPKIIMLVVLFVMLAIILTADIVYVSCIDRAIANAATTGRVLDDFVFDTRTMLIAHMVLVILSAILTATIPLYGKLFKKVKTSIEVEYTEADEEVELASEE